MPQQQTTLAPCWTIARTHGCVRNDSETHETVLLVCTTGEAGSAIQQHQSSAFHCHVAHTPGRSCFYHTYLVQTELRWRSPNEFDTTELLIFQIHNLFHCIAESWWNITFKGTRHGDAVVYVIVATLIWLFSIMTSRDLNTYCHVTQCMNGLWIFITKTWIAQGRFINISRTPSKQWGVYDNDVDHVLSTLGQCGFKVGQTCFASYLGGTGIFLLSYSSLSTKRVNTLRQRQDGHHFCRQHLQMRFL